MKIIYYHEPFSKKVIIGKLIISYSFWRSSYPFGGLILQVEFLPPVLIVVVNLMWRQVFLNKLQFVVKYLSFYLLH